MRSWNGLLRGPVFYFASRACAGDNAGLYSDRIAMMSATPIPSPAVSPALAEALALHARGQLREAETRYARILVHEPKNNVARYQLGLARLQRGELDSGIAAMRQVLKIAPDHAEARFDLARALVMQGWHAEALPHFQR